MRVLPGKRNHTNHRVGQDHQHAKVDDETVRFVRELGAEGFGYTAISIGTGIPVFTVRDWVTYRTRASA